MKRTMPRWFATSQVVVFALLATSAEAAQVEEVEFVSHGAKLSGSIVLPESSQIHAAVVFIHGSGEQTRDLALAQRFANEGIAALVYDKRGVGKSDGKYERDQSVSEKNIALLADDANAALNALAKHSALQGKAVGFAGISQAGWIAPLAAEKNERAQFLVLWSGPVCKVSEEDIYSKYTDDSDRERVPPYQEALDARTVKYLWPDFLGKDTDPSDSLAKLAIPGIWIFSDNDASVPVDLSIERLQRLRKSGHRYDYVLFSGLGHNNMNGTFGVATEWVRKVAE